jgi:hypothetical protein
VKAAAPSPIAETDLGRSALLADESRLSLIASAVVGAMEIASSLDECAALRKALFLCALEAATLREKVREALRSS